MTSSVQIFDRALVRRHLDRAAARFARHHRVLHETIADELLARLAVVRKEFATILDLGAHDGYLAAQLAKAYPNAYIIAAGLSQKMLQTGMVANLAVVDEELLPFAPESFDLIVSNLSLHWVNDLPGALSQIHQALKPDGLFLAALPGAETLNELRACLLEAELTLCGGASPRLSPAIDRASASALLQRAGFKLPVTDFDALTMTYGNLTSILHDLRGMGETNAQFSRLRRTPPRTLFELAEHLYRERFVGADGRFPATVATLYLHGWR